MHQPEMAPDLPAPDAGLGFNYRARKGGVVEIRHHHTLAATLRGQDALEFIAEAQAGEFADGQQLMARLTGNYKRGNERMASNHHRNRR